MEPFDFDRQFRLMELADNDAEVERLTAEIRAYLDADPAQKAVRLAARREAVGRWHNRSMIELTAFKDLLGQPATA